MTNLRDYASVNKALWNAKTPWHVQSAFYDMAAFRAGKNTLNDIELALLGDVRGKSVLHLQCHFGQDSLSLARMGAKVTGVDLSETAIATANQLAQELNLDARFVCANVYDVPRVLNEQYDIVFSSYGTIVWLPDMDEWARMITGALKPGGYFVFAETHPFVLMYDDNLEKVTYSYFNDGEIIETEQGTYADRNAPISLESRTWNHSLGEVMNALMKAGLTLTDFHEHDYCPYPCFGNMTETAPGRFQMTGNEGKVPLIYSLKALKPWVFQGCV
jgi:2-polyprenyl-3-methyl-5-hydroxy-6-metoxy-1,4-benzoquinol methylase